MPWTVPATVDSSLGVSAVRVSGCPTSATSRISVEDVVVGPTDGPIPESPCAQVCKAVRMARMDLSRLEVPGGQPGLPGGVANDKFFQHGWPVQQHYTIGPDVQDLGQQHADLSKHTQREIKSNYSRHPDIRLPVKKSVGFHKPEILPVVSVRDLGHRQWSRW